MYKVIVEDKFNNISGKLLIENMQDLYDYSNFLDKKNNENLFYYFISR